MKSKTCTSDSTSSQQCRNRRAGIGSWIWGGAVILLFGLAMATPAAAAECPDADGDAWADCTTEPTCHPYGHPCGDCDDTDPKVNPGGPPGQRCDGGDLGEPDGDN